MFEDFYAMDKTPFCRNIPCSEIYRNESVKEAIGRLRYACMHKQFVVLSGESGTGKTTVMRCVKEELFSPDYVFAYIAEQHLEPRMLYNQILNRLGYNRTMMQFANARLTLQREIGCLQGRKLVVMIDEGHELSYDMIGEIRFMLNYKMDSESPFALIISAKPEFMAKLSNEDFRSTLNRVDIECQVENYKRLETREYIERQVAYSGHKGTLFTELAIDRIYKASHGNPAMINRLCIQALRLAAQDEEDCVNEGTIDSVLNLEVTTTH
ncbi:MAG: AAA family ATPase [Clostridia bacterium]|nr:AAA family ATPase [Clostridia bacterium]